MDTILVARIKNIYSNCSVVRKIGRTLKYLINKHVLLSIFDFGSSMFALFQYVRLFCWRIFPFCLFIPSCLFIVMVKIIFQIRVGVVLAFNIFVDRFFNMIPLDWKNYLQFWNLAGALFGLGTFLGWGPFWAGGLLGLGPFLGYSHWSVSLKKVQKLSDIFLYLKWCYEYWSASFY